MEMKPRFTKGYFFPAFNEYDPRELKEITFDDYYAEQSEEWFAQNAELITSLEIAQEWYDAQNAIRSIASKLLKLQNI